MKKGYSIFCAFVLTIVSLAELPGRSEGVSEAQRRPNILFAIADDQSFPHVSALGSNTFRTPFFDEVAAKGVMFLNSTLR